MFFINKYLHIFKHTFIILSLLFIYFLLTAFSYSKTVSENISDSIFRLHVLANSNSDTDQNLKYLVRDRLLEYMNELCLNVDSKSEAILLVLENKETFETIALDVIQNEGFDYDCNISIGNFYFPTKSYDDITFPAGNYDALRVEIGEAVGENWWCVMFPPLCFVDTSTGIVPESSKEQLEADLSSEEIALVSSEIEFKFKIVELFNTLFN